MKQKDIMIIPKLWAVTEGESFKGESSIGDDNEFSLGHVEFEVPIGHSSGDAKWGVLSPKNIVRAGDRDSRAICT